MGEHLPAEPAPDTRVSIFTDRSMSLASMVERYGSAESISWTTWEHVARGRLSGVAWWEALEIDDAVVVNGRIAGVAGLPWGSVDGGWIMSDGSRAATVGEAVSWGTGWWFGSQARK